MRNRIRVQLVLTLLGIMIVSGCGAELLAGGQREGEVSAVATDAPERHSTTRMSRAGDPAPREVASARPLEDAVPLEGTLDATASVVLIAEDGEEVPVTIGAVDVQLRLAASDTMPLGRRSIAAGNYVRARVVLSRLEADVMSGLLVGGVPILGRVLVEIGPEPLVVEEPVQVAVRENEPLLLVLNLNSTRWLDAVDPRSLRVAPGDVRGAVEIDVR